MSTVLTFLIGFALGVAVTLRFTASILHRIADQMEYNLKDSM